MCQFDVDILIKGAIRDEFNMLSEFYKTNRHTNVITRPDKMFRAALEEGRFVIGYNERNEVCCAAASFPYFDGAFIEIGKMRSILTGFGLQKILGYCLCMQQVFVDERVDTDIFTITEEDSLSYKNLKCIGFEKWSPSKNLLEEREKVIGIATTEEDCFLRLPRAAVAEHARKLLELVENPYKISWEGKTARINVLMHFITDLGMREVMKSLAMQFDFKN